MKIPDLSFRRARRPVDARNRYVEFLAELRSEAVAVVYAIYADDGTCLYVGESHSGRFGQAYDTITRHFRQWSIDDRTDATGRRRGGTMYHRSRVRVAFARVPASQVEAVQAELIARLEPSDNVQMQGAA